MSPLADAVAHYREHGWARMPALAPLDIVARLRSRAEEIATGQVSYPGLFFQPDTPTGKYEDLIFGHGWAGPTAAYRKIEKLEQDPEFWAWLAGQQLRALVAAVIGGPVSLYRAVIFSKAAHTGSNLPWHQDAGLFWGLSRDPELQIWTALDDAPLESGCLEVFPGSHKLGLATPLGGVVPGPQVLAALADERALAVPAAAGDVMLLHNHLWHRSGPNRTAHPRRAFTVCYLPRDTRCVRKKRAPRSFIPVFD